MPSEFLPDGTHVIIDRHMPDNPVADLRSWPELRRAPEPAAPPQIPAPKRWERDWRLVAPATFVGSLSGVLLASAAGVKPGATLAGGVAMMCCMFALTRLASKVGAWLIVEFASRLRPSRR